MTATLAGAVGLLVAGAALLACAAIFRRGLRPRSLGASGSAAAPAAAVNLLVQIDRGSVHASDDAPGRTISVPQGTTVRALVARVLAEGYLPGIAGGQATWVVESSAAGAPAASQPIAVTAQQWAEAVFLVPADVSLAAHFGATPPRLHWRYRCQDDPDAVVAALQGPPR